LAEMFPRPKSTNQVIGQIALLVMFAALLILPIGLVVGFLRGEMDALIFVLSLAGLVIIFYRPLFVFALGPLLISFGLLNSAETYYSLMLRFAPQFGFAFANRAVVRQKRGDVENALADYDKALAIADQKAHLAKPPFWSVSYSAAFIHVSKAELYLVQGKPQEAVTEFDAALQLNEAKQSLTLYWEYRRAYAQIISGSYEDALNNLDSLYFDNELEPDEAAVENDIHALKALAYQALNRPAEAQAAWQQAITLNPNYANPAWLRDTLLLPEPLLTLATAIQQHMP